MAPSISYIMKYSRRAGGSPDRVGGLPDHLPYTWPRCQLCQERMGFVGQLYASAWFQIGGHLALQFYVCDECKEDHKHLNMEALPKSAPPNAKGAGVHCPSQPKRYISYTPVEDSTDQWTLNRSKLAEEELPDKHLREDKIGGLFPYDGYDSPKITKSNIMIAQFSWKGIGAMVYLYHSTHHGIYAYLYW